MAYYNIVKRFCADGSIRYRCTAGIKQDGKHLWRESKTFRKLVAARGWGMARVDILEQGVPDQGDINKITTGMLLKRYILDPGLGGKAGKTKRHVLSMLAESDVADIPLSGLSVRHIIEHCRYRAASGAGPATVAHDICYLSSVLCAAKPVYGIDYTENPAREARPLLSSMGLIGKSQKRSRRPSHHELEKLFTGLQKRSQQREAKIPYEDILQFSILSCMRIGEICKLYWSDINHEQRAILVRNRKDPRKKTGNHMMVPLLGEAWEIVQRQPETDEIVFPYNPRSVTSGFQRVCKALGIRDLRYHDMRREGASRLFEAGFSIEDVAQVTGHRSLNILWQVYTELFPKNLHAKFDKIQQNNKQSA